MGDEQFRDLRSFGRRRSRRLTERRAHLLETVLPEVSIDLADPPPPDLRRLFEQDVRQVWIEIGFGGGEHLIWQAGHNPDVGIIGCEPFIDGTVKVLDVIADQPFGNVRLYPDDARDVLRWLPAESLDRCFILFPDPWPKKRHNKRRLISVHTLNLLARVLKPMAELRVATDIGDYARTMLLAFAETGAFQWTACRPQHWRSRPADWPETRYEQKAIKENRRSYYFSMQRKCHIVRDAT